MLHVKNRRFKRGEFRFAARRRREREDAHDKSQSDGTGAAGCTTGEAKPQRREAQKRIAKAKSKRHFAVFHFSLRLFVSALLALGFPSVPISSPPLYLINPGLSCLDAYQPGNAATGCSSTT